MSCHHNQWMTLKPSFEGLGYHKVEVSLANHTQWFICMSLSLSSNSYTLVGQNM